MRLVVVHTVLLLGALALAYQTWTRDDLPREPGSVALWNRSAEDVSSITYRGDVLHVVLERRRDDAGSYLWGTVTRALPGDTAEPTQFLVGEYTEQLLATLAEPRALRDLGEVDAEREREYGLTDTLPRLSVEFGRDARTLLVGGTVFGTRDRYVKDVDRGRVYVLPGIAIENLEAPESGLPDRRPHAFAMERVATVTVRTSRGERTMRKGESSGFAPATWTTADAPDQPDQTFANFMERLQQIWITEYAPSIERAQLEPLARVEYFDANGRAIGHLELFRSESDEGPGHYLATEHTRVLARIYPGIAESLDQDLAQLF